MSPGFSNVKKKTEAVCRGIIPVIKVTMELRPTMLFEEAAEIILLERGETERDLGVFPAAAIEKLAVKVLLSVLSST